MHKILLTFFLNIFCIINLYAQKTLVKDSINGNAIPYAEFHIDGQIFYSDSLGLFNFTKDFKNIVIYKPGYFNKTLHQFSDKIQLSPKTFTIEAVEIKKQIIKSIEEKIKKNNTWIIPFGFQMGFIYENPYMKEGNIKNITLHIKQIYDNKNAVLSISFYKFNGDKIELEPIVNGTIEVPIYKLIKRKNTINLSENNIILPENGIFISFNVLEENGVDFFKGAKQSIRFYNSKTLANPYILDAINKKWIKNSSIYNKIGISLEAAF